MSKVECGFLVYKHGDLEWHCTLPPHHTCGHDYVKPVKLSHGINPETVSNPPWGAPGQGAKL